MRARKPRLHAMILRKMLPSLPDMPTAAAAIARFWGEIILPSTPPDELAAAPSQLNSNVGRVDSLPDAVCRSRPGHWNDLVGAARASTMNGIWARLKTTMMIRYGA